MSNYKIPKTAKISMLTGIKQIVIKELPNMRMEGLRLVYINGSKQINL